MVYCVLLICVVCCLFQSVFPCFSLLEFRATPRNYFIVFVNGGAFLGSFRGAVFIGRIPNSL